MRGLVEDIQNLFEANCLLDVLDTKSPKLESLISRIRIIHDSDLIAKLPLPDAIL